MCKGIVVLWWDFVLGCWGVNSLFSLILCGFSSVGLRGHIYPIARGEQSLR